MLSLTEGPEWLKHKRIQAFRHCEVCREGGMSQAVSRTY